MKSLRIVVFGRVQGVNLRNMTKKFCDEIGVVGSVMNQDDGSVLIIAQSSDEDLDELLRWLKTSPGFSKIENVVVTPIKMNEKFYEFSVIRESNVFKDKGKAFKHFAKRMFSNGLC